ncbi:MULTISPECIES: DUF3034 family protein [Ramlibacter]|uniref:DUF3034 family protein n=1 Tax=Ramlibacter aquaticus TaxID=2780094 RepID=A0ABR9SFU0_9BURK|nr:MULTISPECIES: DUF3034 family protein [Ramlibacter]MBE7941218.1 DUF3034 family protein [Ramlibacter aquaticus]
MRKLLIPAAAALAALSFQAQADTGKLLLTGGVSSIDGAAGGGLTPWAVIGSNASEGEWGLSAHASRLHTRDYGLTTYGVAAGWNERVEVSLARQDFDASPAIALNGIAPFGIQPGEHLKLDIFGAKLRVAGDAVLDSDSLMPQVAVGIEHKQLHPGSLGGVIDFLGAKRSGTDVYVSATKLLLGPGVLLNATLRNTQANENGLLGFGAAAPGRASRSWQAELSAAYLLRHDIAVGAEYRFKPNNLEALGRAAGLGSALHESDWKDVFIAWAPTHHLSFTLAWVDLGRVVPGITGSRRQSGAYAAAQVAF